MAIYKGFELWVCEADGTELQYIRDVIYTFINQTSAIPSFNRDVLATAQTIVDAHTDERINVKSVCASGNDSRLIDIQNLFPGIVGFDLNLILPYNGKRYKLINRICGYYAISLGNLSNGILTSNSWTLYNNNDIQITSFTIGTLNQGNVSFCGITNLTGDLIPNSGQMTAYGQFYTSGERYYNQNVTSSSLNDAIANWWNAIPSNVRPSDPYGGGGTSEPGGGGGSFDDSTDVITIPSYDPVDLLNRSYGNRGFVHVYLPTQAELTQLHSFMWDNSLITEMQKMFNNVADAVISLNLLPLDFTDATPNRGNILMGIVDSQIETTIAKQQFVTLDCGTIEINEFFASYLDYSPYSKLQIYLPYIGVKDLDIDEFMNAYISVKYVIDIVSGACVAFISKTGAIDNDVVKDNPILGVLYQFAGNCALNVPISGANYAQVHAADIGALIGGAGVLGTFLTGGMSAPAAVTGILSTAANVVTSKPAISRGGSIPSTVGYMSIQKPYLILTRPRMCLPEDQNTFTGYPAYVTMTPGDTSGYTEFEIIHLENIPATDAEKNELETLMKTGVIL